MKKIKVNGHDIEIYDSIDEMPIVRFQKYNKYLLIDSGVGSDMQDVMGHIDKIAIYMRKDQKMATIELQNLKQNIYLMQNEVSPKHLAFAVLVKRIDGQEMNDLSDTGLHHVLEILSEAKKGWLDGILDYIKKKIDKELSLYFPGRFEDARVKEYYNELKDYARLKLKRIISGEDVSEACAKVEENMAMLAKPRIFSGAGSTEIAYEKQYEEMCLILSKNMQVDAKKMTVLQFYNAFDYLKKLTKQKNAK